MELTQQTPPCDNHEKGKPLFTHPGLYNMTAERFSQDFERSVMDKLKEDRRPL